MNSTFAANVNDGDDLYALFDELRVARVAETVVSLLMSSVMLVPSVV